MHKVTSGSFCTIAFSHFGMEVRNSRVTKSSYETELRKMTSHFELLTQSRKIKSFTSSY